MSPLLNHTTQVSVDKTIAEITKMLVEAGARQIMSTYDAEGRSTGLSFALETPQGNRGFKLPVRATAVLSVMKSDGTPRSYQNANQAERTAWRIIKVWLAAQLALISTEMVRFEEVMLPYMQMQGGKTTFEIYQSEQLPALEARTL